MRRTTHDPLQPGLRPTACRSGTAVAWLACGLLAGLSAQAAQPIGCLIEPRLVVELGSPVIGVLEEVRVDRGDRIRKGQILATLKADVERAAANAARGKAQAEAEVQAAIANRDYNRQRLVRAEDLVKKSFISSQALEQAKAEFDVAEQKLAQANEQKRIWNHEHDMARAQLSLRTLVSPINGIVVERYLSPGERVEERPILKLADPDPLRVELFMPVASYRDIRLGMVAKVYPDLPEAGEYEAKVVLVDRIVDPASNTFRVRLELPNPGNELPAGLRCKVALGDQLVGGSGDAGKPSAPPAAKAAVTGIQPAVAKLPAAGNAAVAGAPAAARVSSPPAGAAVNADPAVRDAVEAWRKAWVAKDLDAYVAAYAPDFRGDQASHEDWVKQREARLKQAEGLEVAVRGLKIERTAEDAALVRFAQRYRSAAYNDDTVKTLTLRLIDGNWRIEDEAVEQPRR